MKYYYDYEKYEEAMEDEDWEDNDEESLVVGVTFESSNKIYHYYTNNEELEKGDRLLVKQYQNKRVVVTVVGYCEDDGQANRDLNIIEVENKKRTNKFKKEEETTMKKSNVMNNTKEALTDAKDVAIKVQKGAAVIIAIKTAIYESNLVPDQIKKLVEAGNGVTDLIIGVVLQVVAETFTESEIIQDAAKSANFAGAVSTSLEFTMIQDMIEKVVGNAIGIVNLKTAKKDSEKAAKK